MSKKSEWHRDRRKKPEVAMLFIAVIMAVLTGCADNRAGGSIESELAAYESSESQAKESTETAEENSADADSAAGKNTGEIYVYACGAVNDPGVYKMPEGSRIFELIEKAGGLREDAAQDFVNQALMLNDGDKIKIPTEEEAKKAETNVVAAEADSSVNNAVGAADDGKVNINTASAKELTGISGIGETRANAIITYRENNGAFASIEDIKKVPGIKDGLYGKIKDQIRI